MIFYWLLFILVLTISYSNVSKKDSIIFIFLFLIAIFRSETVGNDLKGGYEYLFNNASFDSNTWDSLIQHNDKGFIYLTVFFKTYIADNYLLYYNILLGFMLILFYKFLKKYSTDVSLSLFCMLAFAYYFECFNGMRQQLCTSLLLMTVPLLYSPDFGEEITKKRIFCFIVLVSSICLFIHKAMLIFLLVIPCVMCYQKKYCSTFYLEIYLILAFGLSIPLARFASNQFAALAYLFQNDTSNIAGYMSIGEGDDSFGEYSIVSNGINTLFCMLCVYYHRYEKSPFLVLYVLGLVLLDPLTQINWIFQRLAYVFMFFRVIVYAELWHSITSDNERNTFRVLLIGYAFMMFYRRLINDNYTDVVPYDTFLFPGFFNI